MTAAARVIAELNIAKHGGPGGDMVRQQVVQRSAPAGRDASASARSSGNRRTPQKIEPISTR